MQLSLIKIIFRILWPGPSDCISDTPQHFSSAQAGPTKARGILVIGVDHWWLGAGTHFFSPHQPSTSHPRFPDPVPTGKVLHPT